MTKSTNVGFGDGHLQKPLAISLIAFQARPDCGHGPPPWLRPAGDALLPVRSAPGHEPRPTAVRSPGAGPHRCETIAQEAAAAASSSSSTIRLRSYRESAAGQNRLYSLVQAGRAARACYSDGLASWRGDRSRSHCRYARRHRTGIVTKLTSKTSHLVSLNQPPGSTFVLFSRSSPIDKPDTRPAFLDLFLGQVVRIRSRREHSAPDLGDLARDRVPSQGDGRQQPPSRPGHRCLCWWGATALADPGRRREGPRCRRGGRPPGEWPSP